MSNLLIRPLRYHGHFILVQTKAQLVIFLLKETPLIWPLCKQGQI